jgi:hypothetical protein
MAQANDPPFDHAETEAPIPDLCCPVCKGPLEALQDGGFWCNSCPSQWPSIADVKRELAQREKNRSLCSQGHGGSSPLPGRKSPYVVRNKETTENGVST